KFQQAPFLGSECALQQSVPVLRNGTPSAGSACNFSMVSTLAVSSTWLLPSDSSTCGQLLMDSANHYQRAGTNMMPALIDQRKISSNTTREMSSSKKVEMETSLGLTSSSQILCLQKSPDICNDCIQDVQMKTPPVDEERSLRTLLHSPTQFLALPPVIELKENNNVDEMTAEQSMTLCAFEGTKENQDVSFLPPTHIDRMLSPNYTDTGSLRQKLPSDNFTLGRSSLGLQDPESVHGVRMPIIDFADMTTVVSDIDLPQLLNTLTDLEQLEDPEAPQSIIRADLAQECSRVIIGLSEQVNKNNQKASDLLHGTPWDATQSQDIVEGEEPKEARACSTEETTDNMAKDLEAKAQKPATRRPRVARAPWQDKIKKTRDISSKKTKKLKPFHHRVKAEEKPTISKTKRKRCSSGLNNDSFKKPRTHLGMHMLEAVQVFHPLGKKCEKKTDISSSQGLLNFSSNKVPRAGSGTISLQGVSCDSLSHSKIPAPAHQPETPLPGKFKLVPLPFLTLDKPQTRPPPRKHIIPATHKPHGPSVERPPSHLPQPTTLKPSQPAAASTSLIASDKPVLPFDSKVTQPNLTNPIQSCTGIQPPAYRPAPSRADSQISLLKEFVSAAKNKTQSPSEPKIHYLVQDFSCQPIPWRKVEIPGPVTSQPITEKQRPEREAMKRQAQQERENAAKYPSQGKLQIFLQREEDMAISRYYGYAM
ncbi:hypothetical protein HispidOSU_000279, partial [Sigmodon hispidus]